MKQINLRIPASAFLAFLLIHAPPVISAEALAPAGPAYKPTAEEMILDGLVYRPLSLVGTLVGTGVFVVTLPFSLLGGNVEEAGETLVVEPARDTFTRCLGCIDLYSRERW